MFDLTALVLLSIVTGLLVGWHLFSSDARRLKNPKMGASKKTR